METMFMICAAAGGTFMVCQFAMTLFGLGGDHELGGDHDFSHDVPHDVHHDVHHGHAHGHYHGSSWLFGVLTFRSVVAAITFFGLGGWAMTARGYEGPTPFLVGLAAGGGALFLVAWLMQSLYRMQSEGNVRIDRAVGTTGTVYVPIPGGKTGAGKVTLKLQNRTMEYQAVTSQGELPTGARIVVVSVVNSDTVEVAPATDTERVVTHA